MIIYKGLGITSEERRLNFFGKKADFGSII